MKKYIFIISFLILSVPIFASGTIHGRVIDASNKNPIEFVTVSLHTNANKVIGGTLTNHDGVFNLSSIPDGSYRLKISYVGYLPFEKEIKVAGKEISLGDIALTENTKELKEVQVVGQGSQMRFDIDKKVFSVDQNIAAAGGSATDVLQNIPSVNVDNDGNVSLRNNASVEVWINGKPSGLTAENRAQVLQQMPAGDIEAIEIMTNPSAKFSPEGTAGIINLVMKKTRKAGYYGSVSTGATLSAGKLGGNLGASINYNVGKFEMFANVGYRQMSSVGTGFTNRKNYNNGDTTLLTQNSTNDFTFGGTFFRAGVDYHLNDKNTIGIAGFGHLGTPRQYSTTNYLLKNVQSNSVLSDYTRTNDSKDSHNGYHVNLNHKYDLDNKGSNIISSVGISNHSNLGSMRYAQRNAGSSTNNLDILQQADGGNDEIELKTDFTKKFNDNDKLEAGWESNWSDRLSTSSAFDHLTNKDIPSYYNLFDYKEQIHAAYLTYGQRIKNFSFQAGLRGEYLRKEISSTSRAETVRLDPKSYFQLFPSMYLSYSLPNNNELQLNYTRRVNRPRGRQINPFRDYSDPTNISYGNPELMPEFASAFELNYLKSWDNHSMSASAYYRFTDDVIQRISYMNGGTLESTFMNLTKQKDAGFEFVVKNRLFKVLNLTTSLNAYYSKMDSATYTNALYPSVKVGIPAQDHFSWDVSSIANVLFSPTFSGQITGRYSSPQIVAQGRRDASYNVDLGLRKTFFDRKLSVNFNVRDIFNSRKFKGATWGKGFYQTFENKRFGRMFGLTLTYSFGNMKPKKQEHREQSGGMDDGGEMDM